MKFNEVVLVHKPHLGDRMVSNAEGNAIIHLFLKVKGVQA